MAKKIKLGILVSGGGTNLQAIIDNIEQDKLDAEIAVVISDNKDAYGLVRAKNAGIDAVYIEPGKYKTKLEPEIEQKYVDCLKSHGVELVCLAGFMRMIKETILNAFPQKIINIHPALLPAFPGLDVQQKAIDYGVKFSGATVHYVDEGMDTGRIITQAVVPVYEDDTKEILAARILEQEHRIYSEAIQMIAEREVISNQ